MKNKKRFNKLIAWVSALSIPFMFFVFLFMGRLLVLIAMLAILLFVVIVYILDYAGKIELDREYY